MTYQPFGASPRAAARRDASGSAGSSPQSRGRATNQLRKKRANARAFERTPRALPTTTVGVSPPRVPPACATAFRSPPPLARALRHAIGVHIIAVRSIPTFAEDILAVVVLSELERVHTTVTV